MTWKKFFKPSLKKIGWLLLVAIGGVLSLVYMVSFGTGGPFLYTITLIFGYGFLIGMIIGKSSLGWLVFALILEIAYLYILACILDNYSNAALAPQEEKRGIRKYSNNVILVLGALVILTYLRVLP